MLTMFHGVRARVSDWRFSIAEWWKRQRIESRAMTLCRDHSLFSLNVLHGHRLNRLKQWTLATESMEENPLFSRRLLDRSLIVERRLCREAQLAIQLKTIEEAIDDAADHLESSAAASADGNASAD